MNASGNVNSQDSPAMRQATALLSAGDTVGADRVMTEAVRAVEQRFGKGTTEYATAQGELAGVLLACGQMDRAIDAFQEACAGPDPDDPQAMRDRLTHLMNLGQILQRANRLDEAQDALVRGLEGREKVYGREHPGYAFGLEPLADLMLRRDKLDLATEMADEVVANFWRAGHPRVASALVLRADAMLAAGKTEPPFSLLAKLPNDVVAAVVQNATERILRGADLRRSRRLLAELSAVVSSRLGADHPQVVNLLITRSNIERSLGPDGDVESRQALLREVITGCDRRGQAREALDGMQALALAQGEAGQNDRAAESYREALARAERLGDADARSQVLRNWGLLLRDAGESAQAEEKLREAVDAAEGRASAAMLGRAQVALGVFLQRADRPAEARPLLESTIRQLSPADPEAVTARSHLNAIEAGGPCGCGDTSEAITDAFREFVLAKLPGDLLDRIDVQIKDGDFDLGVHLKREPSPEEVENLERVIHHALGEFRSRLLRDSANR